MEDGMRKTKIVCTLGPSTDDEEVLENLCLSRNECCKNQFLTW